MYSRVGGVEAEGSCVDRGGAHRESPVGEEESDGVKLEEENVQSQPDEKVCVGKRQPSAKRPRLFSDTKVVSEEDQVKKSSSTLSQRLSRENQTRRLPAGLSYSEHAPLLPGLAPSRNSASTECYDYVDEDSDDFNIANASDEPVVETFKSDYFEESYDSDDFNIASDSDDFNVASDSDDFNIASDSDDPVVEALKSNCCEESFYSDDFNIANASDDPLVEALKSDSCKESCASDLNVKNKLERDLRVFDFESDDTVSELNESDFEIAEGNFTFSEQLDESKSEFQRSVCCELRCNLKSVPDDVKIKLESIIKDKKKIDIKNELLGHLKSQKRMGFPTSGFFFGGDFMCSKRFSEVSGLSRYIIAVVMEDFGNGLIRYEHGNTDTFQLSAAKTGFICWMRTFSDVYGQSAPDQQVVVLPSFLTIKDLYEIYAEEAEEPKVKCSTFYSLLKKCFGWNREDKTLPHIRLSAWSTHSKCDQCIALNRYRRSCKTEESLAHAKSLKMAHKDCYGKARSHIESLRHLALDFPQSRLFIQIDDMGKFLKCLNSLVEHCSTKYICTYSKG